MEWIDAILESKLVMSAIAIMIGVIVFVIVDRIFSRVIEKNAKINHKNEKKNRRRATYFRLVRSIIRYAIIILVILAVLAIYGVDVSSILVSLGIATVIAGLALQDALKDIIMGFNLVTDEFFSVGDVVDLTTAKARVVELGLKSTRLIDISTGDKIVIANRNISKATVVSRKLVFTFPLPYSIKTVEAKEFIGVVMEKIKVLDGVQKVEKLGLDKFATTEMNFKLAIYGDPLLHGKIKRAANQIVWELAEERGLELSGDPTEVKILQ